MGDIDSGHAVEIRLRWPPFDPDTVIATELPIATECFRLTEETETPCEVEIGDESGFHIHRRIIRLSSGLSQCRDWVTLTNRIPGRVERERKGWYLSPSKMHRKSRRLIPFAVIGIIASLAIHAFEPALVNWGWVEGSFAGSVRVGLLDYPVLLLIFLPVFFIPIMMRLLASVWDFRRTRKFRSDLPADPTIIVQNDDNTSEKVTAKFEFPEIQDDWISAEARIQVGLLNPRRPMLLHALGRKDGQQNPPGISTPLSIRQYAISELGTGFGESTPLEGPDTKRLFLSPLPVQCRGPSSEIPLLGDTVNLTLPEGDWPGSEYHPLFATHWEVMIRIEREQNGPLLFVNPLIMKHDGRACHIAQMPTQSGRSEMADS
ncbi:MAG TPA: hypothetical protein QF514_02470 [Candidatus Thalassarchaeaceae archaeon]|nr:hypothetical protein [Candidatus Thalassarchaeaceae archaeon]